MAPHVRASPVEDMVDAEVTDLYQNVDLPALVVYLCFEELALCRFLSSETLQVIT